MYFDEFAVDDDACAPPPFVVACAVAAIIIAYVLACLSSNIKKL